MVEAAAKGASVILVGLNLRSMRCLLEGFFDLKHLRSSTGHCVFNRLTSVPSTCKYGAKPSPKHPIDKTRKFPPGSTSSG